MNSTKVSDWIEVTATKEKLAGICFDPKIKTGDIREVLDVDCDGVVEVFEGWLIQVTSV